MLNDEAYCVILLFIGSGINFEMAIICRPLQSPLMLNADLSLKMIKYV